jgi:hypothetical protein
MKLLHVVRKLKGLIWYLGILSSEGISTKFSGEGWQSNSSPFSKISKFTYDIGIVEFGINDR